MKLELSNWGDFDKVGEFTLICSATGASQVNLIPIYHLGRQRIKGLVIQTGSSGGRQSDADIIQGNIPREWLAWFAGEELGLPPDRIHVVAGNSDRIADQWAQSASKALEWGLPVLYNVSGGTAQMTAATMRALDAQSVPYTIVSLDKSPSRVRLSGLIGNRFCDRAIKGAAISSRVPPQVLMDSKGLKMLRSAAKQEEVEYFQGLAREAERIWDAYWANPNHGRAALQQIGRAIQDKTFSLSTLEPGKFGKITALFDSESPEWNGGDLKGQAIKFYGGGWLEQYIYSKAMPAARGKAIEFFPGIEICALGDPPRGEMDLLVLEGDVPHIVEVKAQMSANDRGDPGAKVQAWIDRLAALRQALGGMPSKAWIVAPFLEFTSNASASDFAHRAEDAQLRIYTGSDAARRLYADLKALGD